MNKMLYKMLLIFSFAAICLTILSRGMYHLTLATVHTATAKGAILEETVEGTGTVEKKAQIPIFIEENLFVENILISEGQQVQADDILVEVELSELDKYITELDQQIGTLNYQIADIKTNQSIDHQNRQREIDLAVGEYERMQAKVSAEAEKAGAEMNQAYENYSASGEETSELATELYSEYEAKVDAYNLICSEGQEQVQNTIDQLNSLQKTENVDSSAAIHTLELERLTKKRDELAALKQRNGQILAPKAGAVKCINIAVGDLSTKSAVIILDDLESESQIEADLSVKDKAAVRTGDTVMVKGTDADGKAIVEEDAEVISVSEDIENNILKVIINITDNKFTYGASASFVRTLKSQPYSECIPISCLREEQNQYFIYTVDEGKSILGKQNIAKKVYVEVLDKDSKNAAIKGGVLTQDTQVICESNKNLEEGNRIKLWGGENSDEE